MTMTETGLCLGAVGTAGIALQQEIGAFYNEIILLVSKGTEILSQINVGF